ncbi:hypothetical protein DIPPA_35245 [Diplonema papillatum]|nr:hypothetical protein DIPPA_35245 [Diplonema papillatum]
MVSATCTRTSCSGGSAELGIAVTSAGPGDLLHMECPPPAPSTRKSCSGYLRGIRSCATAPGSSGNDVHTALGSSTRSNSFSRPPPPLLLLLPQSPWLGARDERVAVDAPPQEQWRRRRVSSQSFALSAVRGAAR